MSLYQDLMGNQTNNYNVNNNNNTQMQMMLMDLIKNNPNIQKVLSAVSSSNMTPKALFYQMANQKGVNPNQILNILNSKSPAELLNMLRQF